nr:hypothetical protein [Tanacetum cinerariifolium]
NDESMEPVTTCRLGYDCEGSVVVKEAGGGGESGG